MAYVSICVENVINFAFDLHGVVAAQRVPIEDYTVVEEVDVIGVVSRDEDLTLRAQSFVYEARAAKIVEFGFLDS